MHHYVMDMPTSQAHQGKHCRPSSWSTMFAIPSTFFGHIILWLAGHGSSIGWASVWYVDCHWFDPHVQQIILSLRFGHEKKSTTILSLPPIPEEQFSVTGERMGTKY